MPIIVDDGTNGTVFRDITFGEWRGDSLSFSTLRVLLSFALVGAVGDTERERITDVFWQVSVDEDKDESPVRMQVDNFAEFERIDVLKENEFLTKTMKSWTCMMSERQKGTLSQSPY